jgi:hypothetical protein
MSQGYSVSEADECLGKKIKQGRADWRHEWDVDKSKLSKIDKIELGYTRN